MAWLQAGLDGPMYDATVENLTHSWQMLGLISLVSLVAAWLVLQIALIRKGVKAKRLPLRGKLSPQVTDEGRLCGSNPLTGNRGRAALIGLGRGLGHLPPRGKAFTHKTSPGLLTVRGDFVEKLTPF